MSCKYIAVNHPEVFRQIVEEVKKVLPPQGEAPNLDELKKRFGKTSKPDVPKEAKSEKKEEAKVEEKAEEEKVQKKTEVKEDTAE